MAIALLPGALIVYLGFNAGGFFPGATGLAAVVVALALVLRVTLAERPFAGYGPALQIAAGALALYAVWTLLSSGWSDAPARALLEFDRAVLYLLVLLLVGSLPGEPAQLRLVIYGLVLGATVVCVAGLASRVAPDIVHASPDIVKERLSFPVTYWNALGLLAGLALIAAAHLTCDAEEPRAVRVVAAGTTPLLAATLLFTYSRGAIAAAALGLATYLALGRPRHAVAGLLAAVPASAVAVIAAYRANLLASDEPTTSAAAAQGHRVALAVGACGLAAALVRVVLLRVDARAVATARVLGYRAKVAAVALGTAAMVATVLALDVPEGLATQYDRFVAGNSLSSGGDQRSRLADPANNGRLDQWRIALDGFEEEPLHGAGAGTYRLQWVRERPEPRPVNDAHSLYLEALDELGLVGATLLVVAVLAALGGVAARIRGAERAAYAAAFATSLAWAIHAGFDWDWEMPVVTVWFFAAVGAGLAFAARSPQWRPPRLGRVLLGLGIAGLAVAPALVAVSQVRLNRSVEAFERGDCATAIDTALASTEAMNVRPEPFEVLGYCDARLGDPRLGERAMRAGLRRDPDNWELHYGLAIVRGAGGRDPRPALRAARRLNPRGILLSREALRVLNGSRREWRRWASTARLPLQRRIAAR